MTDFGALRLSKLAVHITPDGQLDFRTSICLSVFAENMTSEEAASCSAIFGFIILASTND